MKKIFVFIPLLVLACTNSKERQPTSTQQINIGHQSEFDTCAHKNSVSLSKITTLDGDLYNFPVRQSQVNINKPDPKGEILKWAGILTNAEGWIDIYNNHFASETLDIKRLDNSNLKAKCSLHSTSDKSVAKSSKVNRFEAGAVSGTATSIAMIHLHESYSLYCFFNEKPENISLSSFLSELKKTYKLSCKDPLLGTPVSKRAQDSEYTP